MTIFDVILVPFPFSNLRSKKKRPCVILTRFRPRELPEHFIVAMITSNMGGIGFPHDFKIEKWSEAGLPKPSVLRVSKLVTIDSSIALRTLGRLSKVDQSRLKKSFAAIFTDLRES